MCVASLRSSVTIFLACILCSGSLYPNGNFQNSPLEKTHQQVIKNACGTDPIEEGFAQHLLVSAPARYKETVALLKKAQEAYYLSPVRKICPKRILLVGPPGSGKSTLARLLAQILNRNLIFVRAPMLGTEYQNSEIVNLTAIFEYAFYSPDPIVLVLDEINVLAEARKNNPQGDQTIAATLWLLLDKCAEYQHIFVVGTCNDATKLPVQLKDRFIGNIIEVPGSSERQRFKTLVYYRDYYKLPCMDEMLLHVARKTDGFSTRQLEALVTKIYQIWLLDQGINPLVLKRHLDKAYYELINDAQLMENKKARLFELMEKYSYVLPYVNFGMQAAALISTGVYYMYKGTEHDKI